MKAQYTDMKAVRGQALVEMAFVLPILLLAGLNILTLADVYGRYGQVYQAGSTGARMASISGGSSPAVQDAVRAQLAASGISDVQFCAALAGCDPNVNRQVRVHVPAAPVPYGQLITLTIKYRYDVNLLWVMSLTPTRTWEIHVISESY